MQLLNRMIGTLMVGTVVLATATTAAAQEHLGGATTVARRAADLWNAQASLRVNGSYSLDEGKSSDGTVAVINGPITVNGTIRGTLVAINADVRLSRSARIERDLIVIGGTITGRESASVGGELVQQDELIRYHLDDGQLQIDREPEYDESWWRRRRFRRERPLVRPSDNWAYSEFPYIASRSYNRIEGWSFEFGPRMQRMSSWGGFSAELYAIGRTAAPMRWDRESIGHDVKLEMLFGRPIGVALGARAFDLVQPTEDWQLGEGEVGLASALLHRDYRDYYVRHGGEIYAKLVATKSADLTMGLSHEDWSNRAARDPWSFNSGASDWRPNPHMDVGQVHLLNTRLRIDTRTRERSPLGGWYVTADLEQGGGRITRFGAPVVHFAPPSPENVWYSRAFFDVRRYNRVAPGMSLDLRAALGGWVAGDPLPTQRRLGVDGPGTLPGYDFRQLGTGPDLLNCYNGIDQPGRPAQCDRVALAQAQLRSKFIFSSWRDDGDDDWWRPGFNSSTSWVFFADAGRGWMVDHAGTQSHDPVYHKGNSLPALESFKLDMGAGIDFGDFGVYWAKAMRNGDDDPVRFIVRLQHRF